MAYDSDIGGDEKDAINELRSRVKGDIVDQDIYNDLHFFLRFLRAQDFNINNAESMLRKHLEWRVKNDVKNFKNFKEKIEVFEKYFVNELLGYDKEGCVIRYSPVGSIDLPGIFSCVTMDDLNKFFVHEHETDSSELKKQSEKLGKNVDKCVYIYNLENFSFANATDKRVLYNFMHLVRLYVNNYPDRLKAAYVINVPMCFHLIYAALKTVLPASLVNKINLYSDDSYKEVFLKAINEDVLPAFLGGTRTDPDGNPLCITFLSPEGPVPKEYYLQKSEKSLAKAPDVQIITLTRAAFHEVKLEVEEAGSYLEWEFETKCRDIGFGLFYNEMIDGEEKITELSAIQRIDTEQYPETGTFYCKHPGTYVIVFDNTYSVMRSKEIYYRAKVVTPKEHEDQLKE